MAIWTVFEPEDAEAAPSLAHWAGGVVLVPERLSWTSIPFAPLVLLAHRLWLAFLVYVVVQAALVYAIVWFELGNDALVLVLLTNLAVALLLPGLRCAKLIARGYEEVGAIVAPTLEAAEQRYIAARLGASVPRAPAPLSAGRLAPAPVPERPVLGLFPEASR